MLSNNSNTSIPMIFLITDGTVEDERKICEIMKSHVKNQASIISPRIYTFGIGNVLLLTLYAYICGPCFFHVILFLLA